MANEWYYRAMTAELGPFAPSEMRQFAERGVIAPNTEVRKGTQGPWVEAVKVKGLFPGRAESPPARPNPPPAPHVKTPPAKPLAAVTKDHRGQQRKLAIKPGVTIAGITIGLLVIGVLTVFFGGWLDKRQTVPAASAQRQVATQSAVPSPTAPRPASTVSAVPSSARSVPAPGLSTEEMIARSEASVALISTDHSVGTGFLLQAKIVATNKHVIVGADSEPIRVHFPSADERNRGPFAGRLLYQDPTKDLAFLYVDTDLNPLTLAQKYEFRRGQEVVVIGNPGVKNDLILKNAISKGVMSTETTIEGQPYYQLGISINPGNSGGPVLDAVGEVIGVITLKAVNKEGLGFCIPLAQLQDALKALKSGGESGTSTVSAKPIETKKVNFDIGGMQIGARFIKQFQTEVIELSEGGRVTIFYKVKDDHLIGATLSFKSDLYPLVVKAYIAKFDAQPHKTELSKVTTKVGVEYENETVSWETNSGRFELFKYSGNINNGGGMLFSPELMQEFKDKIKAKENELKSKL